MHFAVNDGVDAYIINGITQIIDTLCHAVVVTFDEDTAANCKIYLDGYDDTSDKTGTLGNIGDCSNAGVFSIGGEADAGLPFDGYVQDAAVYDGVVLTAANALTYATTPQTELGSPNAWYPFRDAAAATEIGDEATTLNSLDLTLVGGTTTNFGTHSRSQDAFISANLMGSDWDMGIGGIGAWAAGDPASAIAKVSDSKYRKYGNQSLRVKNTDATQAFARMTVATVVNTDYHFAGWFRSPETPNGASQLVDVDAAAAKGITITQAAATTGSTWYKLEFDFEAGDTSATIDLGAGSVTSDEIGYWDGCQIFKNYVDEPGFEATIALSDWATTGAPTVDDANTTERSGVLCYKVNGSSIAYVSQDVTLTLGEDYLFIGHVMCGTADAGKIVLSGAASATLDNESNITTYAEVRYQFTAATTTLTIKIYGNAQDAYYDDFAVIKAETSEYIFDENVEIPTIEWLYQFTGSDGQINQIYYPQAFVQGIPMQFSNKDYSVHDVTLLPVGSFVWYRENP